MNPARFLSTALLVAALVAGPAAFAQGRKGGGQGAPRLEELAKDLNLTDDQKEKLKPILTEDAEKLKALRADDKMERRERAQKMRDIRTDLDAKMKPILNDEQWKKLEESRAKAREEAKKKGGRKG